MKIIIITVLSTLFYKTAVYNFNKLKHIITKYRTAY